MRASISRKRTGPAPPTHPPRQCRPRSSPPPAGEARWNCFFRSFWPILSGGIVGTIPLALSSFVLGLALALAVALMRLSRVKVLAWIARAYISVIRGTPLLVQLFVIFYGLPSRGRQDRPLAERRSSPSRSTSAATRPRSSAPRSSACPRGSGRRRTRSAWAAVSTCGGSSCRRPRASRCRRSPTRSSRLVKDTSLASLILVTELFRQAQKIATASSEFMLLYLEAALIYWLICLVLSSGQSLAREAIGPLCRPLTPPPAPPAAPPTATGPSSAPRGCASPSAASRSSAASTSRSAAAK